MVLVLLPSSPSTTPVPGRFLQLQAGQNDTADETERGVHWHFPLLGMMEPDDPTADEARDCEHQVKHGYFGHSSTLPITQRTIRGLNKKGNTQT